MSPHKLSYKDIKKYGIDDSKAAVQAYADRFFYRPISDIISPFLVNQLSLSPNGVSVLSLIITFIGFCLIITGDFNYGIVGVFFLIVFAMLDCADGSIARSLHYKYNFTNPLGDFFDAFAGYFMIAGLWFSVGIYIYMNNNNPLWIILGSLSSILALYSRVSFVKLVYVKSVKVTKEPFVDERKSKLFLVYENLEFGAFLLPILMISFFLQKVEYVLIGYLAINFLMLLWLFRHVYLNAVKHPIAK